MNQARRDCLVSAYEPLISTLDLRDPSDRHVLSATIVGRCDVIVTNDTKDFPQDKLAPYGLEAQHPDEFLTSHLSLALGVFCAAIRKIRARLKNPPYSADEYLAILTQQGLVATAAGLEAFCRGYMITRGSFPTTPCCLHRA